MYFTNGISKFSLFKLSLKLKELILKVIKAYKKQRKVVFQYLLTFIYLTFYLKLTLKVLIY